MIKTKKDLCYYLEEDKKAMSCYWTYVYHKKSVKLGIQIPRNTCGAGSVVTTLFFTQGITIGCVPARVLNEKKGNPFSKTLEYTISNAKVGE